MNSERKLRKMKRQTAVFGAILGGILVGVVLPGRADVTIVSTIRVKDDDPEEKDAPKQYTQTTYYKGTKRRVEEKGEVRIADAETGKEYSLDVKKKTYSARALPAAAPPAKPEAGADKDADKAETARKEAKEESPVMKTEVEVKPIGKAKTIVGKKARGLRYKISLHPTPQMPVKPVGGSAEDIAAQTAALKNATAMMQATIPTIVMSGEQWMTDEIIVPKALQGESLLPALLNGKAFGSGLTDSDREKVMAQLSGLDLSGVIHIKVMFPKKAREGKQRDSGPQDADVMYTRDVTSISDAGLDDALFTIPADYKLVKSEAEILQESLSKAKEKP